GWRGACVPEVLAWYRRSPQSRERAARRPGVPRKRMRDMVAKHRALYERHLEDAIAGLYEELMQSGATLERIYNHPAVRAGLAVRRLLRGGKPPASPPLSRRRDCTVGPSRIEHHPPPP